MPSRRHFLATVVAVGAAGCTVRAPSASTTTVASLDDGDRVRGRGDELSVDRERSPDDGQSYVPSNETVRYPATRSGGEVDSYGHIAVEEWLQLEAAFVAERAIHAHLDDRLRSTKRLPVSATARGGPETELDVVHATYENADGPNDDPAVSAADLVSETPRTVSVSVRFDGRAATRSYPIFVVKWVGKHVEDRTTGPS